MERFLCGSRAIFPLRVFGSSCASKSVAGGRLERVEERGEREECRQRRLAEAWQERGRSVADHSLGAGKEKRARLLACGNQTESQTEGQTRRLYHGTARVGTNLRRSSMGRTSRGRHGNMQREDTTAGDWRCPCKFVLRPSRHAGLKRAELQHWPHIQHISNGLRQDRGAKTQPGQGLVF